MVQKIGHPSSRFVRKKRQSHIRLLRNVNQAAEAYPDRRDWKDSLGTFTYPANRVPSSFLEAIQSSGVFRNLDSELQLHVIGLRNSIEEVRNTEDRIMDLLYQIDYAVYLMPRKTTGRERILDTMDALIQLGTPLTGIIRSERKLLREMNELALAIEERTRVDVDGLPQDLPEKAYFRK